MDPINIQTDQSTGCGNFTRLVYLFRLPLSAELMRSGMQAGDIRHMHATLCITISSTVLKGSIAQLVESKLKEASGDHQLE